MDNGKKFTLELGRKYRFTLTSGRSLIVIHHGTRQADNGAISTITVNDKIGEYSNLNAALGIGAGKSDEAIVSMTRLKS